MFVNCDYFQNSTIHTKVDTSKRSRGSGDVSSEYDVPSEGVQHERVRKERQDDSDEGPEDDAALCVRIEEPWHPRLLAIHS